MTCITRSGTYGNIKVTITPTVNPLITGISNSFASNFSTSPSQPIIATFDQPISSVSVTAYGTTSPGHFLIAYDENGNELARAEFEPSALGLLEFSTKTIFADNITKIKLSPSAGMWVFYSSLCFTPQTTITQQNPNSSDADYVTIQFSLNIIDLPPEESLNVNLLLNIMPAIPTFNNSEIKESLTLDVDPIPVPLAAAYLSAIQKIISNKISTFFDDERVLKTVLNFGNDEQQLLTNWIYDPADSTNNTILVKLYQPLSNNIVEKTQLWIDREISPPILDSISVRPNIPVPQLVFLRSPNKNIQLSNQQGISIENVTLSSLFPSGSVSISTASATLSDSTLEQYYTTNLKGVELNIDYTTYNNFISFGSATARLNAFKNKLLILENYNATITSQSNALSASLFTNQNSITSSAQYGFISTLLEQRQDLLRSFDGYEKFLYYNTGSQYSSSFTNDIDDTLYFHSQINWPKVNGTVISVASASNAALYNVSTVNYSNQLSDFSWIGKQSYIAQQYDLFNRNALSNNIPTYIIEDVRSADFITFLNLVGYQFDIIKSYVDQMTNIYDRSNSANVGLSKDLVWNVAQSFGVDLPNQFAIKDIVSYLVGSGSLSSKVYRDLIAETWKRFLDNQIYISKTKGTAASLNALLNTYGIRPELIRVRESVSPSVMYPTASFETYSELDNVLAFTSGSSLSIPWNIDGFNDGKYPNTLQVRFSALAQSTTQSMTLLSGDGAWAVILTPLSSGSTSGYVSVMAGSTTCISSSVFSVFSGDYYNVMVRSARSGSAIIPSSVDLTIEKYNNSLLSYYFTGSTINNSLLSSWSSPVNLFIGTSSFNSFRNIGFVGFLDEFRGSSEYINNSTFDDFSRYGGLYYGNTTSSAQTSLYERLSLGIPRNLGATSSLPNESPYISFNPGSHISSFTASGFTNSPTFPYSMSRIYRTVSRYAPDAGHQYSSNKVIIAPPATYRYALLNNGAQVPVLDRKLSVVSKATRKNYVKNNNLIGFYISLTDTINDSIMRSVGRIDISNLIGDPRDLYRSSYSSLDNLIKYYAATYSYSFNLNTFIFFVKNLLGSLFSQAKELVPIRAKMLTGVVIEPNILNRPKIKWNPIKLTGGNAKLNLYSQSFANNFNLTSNINPTSSFAIISSDSTLNMIVQNGTVTSSLIASDATYASQIAYSSVFNLVSSDSTYVANPLQVLTTQSIVAFEPTYFDNIPVTGTLNVSSTYPSYLVDINYGHEVLLHANTFVSQSTSSQLPQTIYPIANFREDNPGAFEYFTLSSGSVGLTTVMAIPVTAIYPTSSKGTWTYGTAYSRGDIVQQVSATGSTQIVAGNNHSFICLTSRMVTPTGSIVNFVSYVPPAGDTANWQQLQSILVDTPRLLQVISNGAGGVSLVPYSVSNTPFTGYSNNHYRFHANNYTAWNRARYTGCKNTIDSTIDGKSPIQTFNSTQPQLVVNSTQPITPVQGINDTSGPILNVE